MSILLEGLSEPLASRLEAMRTLARDLTQPYADPRTHLTVTPRWEISVAFAGAKGEEVVTVTLRWFKPAEGQRTIAEFSGELFAEINAHITSESVGLSWEAFLEQVCHG